MFPIGIQIAVKRQEKGLTQKSLAEKTGIPQPNLSNIEKGKQDLTVASLRKIAFALDTPIAEFFEEKKAPFRLTRPGIERLARAIAGRRVWLSSDEKQFVAWFQDITSQNPRAERIRKMYRSWIELKKRFDSAAIQTVCERVRELK